MAIFLLIAGNRGRPLQGPLRWLLPVTPQPVPAGRPGARLPRGCV